MSDVADPVDAEAVAEAVASCPSVVRLTGGTRGQQVATYLPGRRVHGVRVTDDEVEVHVSSVWGVPVTDVADEVRTVVAPLAHGRPVAVSIDDVEEPVPAAEGDDPSAAVPSPS